MLPQTEEQKKWFAMGYARHVFDEQAEIVKRDEDTRRAVHLRQASAMLVEALDDALEQIAQGLADEFDMPDAFSVGAYRDLLVWQLVEFLTQAHIDRDPKDEFYNSVIKGHQVSSRYAHAWFNLVAASSGFIVPEEEFYARQIAWLTQNVPQPRRETNEPPTSPTA